MHTITMSDSARLAQSILSAWEARDSRRLQDGLDRAVRLRPGLRPLHGIEAERRDALSAVAAQLRSQPQRTDWTSDSARVSVCLRLLGHLSVTKS